MNHQLSEAAIAAALDVHRALGPGLLKSAYEECLCRELSLRGIRFIRNYPLTVHYKGIAVEPGPTCDFVLEEQLLLSVKSVEALQRVHQAQMLSYLSFSGCNVGLTLNFNTERLQDGILRTLARYPEADAGPESFAFHDGDPVDRNESDFQATYPLIGAAIEVHRALGPGFSETVYEECFCRELLARKINFLRQQPLPIRYKGVSLDCGYRLDVLVDSKIVIEIKAVEQIDPIHEAQLLSYLKLGNHPLGLLLNFNVAYLKEGIRRRRIFPSP